MVESSWAAESPFVSVKSLQEIHNLTNDHPQEARRKLETLSVADPQFQYSIEELMKLTYRLHDWPSFFAYAQFYRKYWKSSERSEVQLLEPLALLRHCQNDLLHSLSEELKAGDPKLTDALAQMEHLSRTTFKEKASPSKAKSGFTKHLEGTSLWKLNSSAIEKTHPRKIKIRVENKCSF